MAEDRLADYLPVAVGLGVGVGNRLIEVALPSHPHFTLAYKALLFAVGAAGELTGRGSPNVNYGLMAAVSTLEAEQITSALADHKGSEALTYTAPARSGAPALAAPACGACSAGHTVHPLIAPTTAPNVVNGEVH